MAKAGQRELIDAIINKLDEFNDRIRELEFDQEIRELEEYEPRDTQKNFWEYLGIFLVGVLTGVILGALCQ